MLEYPDRMERDRVGRGAAGGVGEIARWRTASKCQTDLFADRTLTHTMAANQLRRRASSGLADRPPGKVFFTKCGSSISKKDADSA